ncbi:MAG: ABC transporter ATP-binding protein [Rectinemataceae bacterium]
MVKWALYPLKTARSRKYFPLRRGFLQRRSGSLKAVDGISFSVRKGEAFGLVGESGCGKSTAARTILRLYRPSAGRVSFDGSDLASLDRRGMASVRSRMQMIFQDPYSSLNPRMSAGAIVEAPLVIHGRGSSRERRERVTELFELVGLHPSFMRRYPHEFSGGQRQRIGIARALALKPDLVVCDEPIAALDVSVQAQIVNLLMESQRRLGLAYLFIAHDLGMVRHLCDRVAVMYLGKIMELCDSDELHAHPLHPYTRALLSAVPVPNPRIERQRNRIILEGDIPSPADPPSGCLFHTRCPEARERCKNENPEYREVRPAHHVACHYAES